jgi:hypothetical protein
VRAHLRALMPRRWPAAVRHGGGCWAAAVCAAALGTGCVGTAAGSLPLGSPLAEVLQRLGPPTSEYRLQQQTAVRRLEYGGGSFGKSALMLDFDADDRLVGSRQVRNESSFNAVHEGMPRDVLLRTLGRPSEVLPLGFRAQTLWSYRYESPFCQWFQVAVRSDGSVASIGYGPDPRCTPHD